MEWEHLRTFEAVARHGSLTAAAGALKLSQSTVSRHIGRLEATAGSPLFLREMPVRLTSRGEALLTAIAPMLPAALAAQAALDDEQELTGVVTITTVGELCRWVITPRLARFFEQHPRLALHILTDNGVLSLAAGDADIALRFSRPERGDLVARRMHVESYAIFAAPTLRLEPEVSWLGLAGSLAQLSQHRHAAHAFANRRPRLLVEDIESLGHAVAQGLGVAILPRSLGSRLDLSEVEPAQVGVQAPGPLASQELWLVVHRSKQRLPKVRAVMDWLAGVLAAAA